MNEKINVGVTFFVGKDSSHSIWSNGAVQNIIFLYLMLRASDRINKLWLINGGDGESLSPNLMLDGIELPLVRLNDVADQIDVLIEGGAQISAAEAEIVHARKGAVIAYRCGNDYVMDLERLTFMRPSGSIFNGTRFDEVWTHAQHANTCKSYWQIGMRAPVIVLPHIWSPMFLNRTIRDMAKTNPSTRFGYVPGAGAKRVSIFEPNVNVVKNNIYPMLVCEAAHRADKNALKEIYVTNSLHLKEHVTFQYFANALDIVKDKRASFEARFNLPHFLGTYTDIVVTHQWENGLNYLYYDTLYGGYPLVHNSPFLKDIGYYYDGFDAEQGGQALLNAVYHHDENQADYQRKSDALLRSIHVDSPINAAIHVDRMFNLLNKKRSVALR